MGVKKVIAVFCKSEVLLNKLRTVMDRLTAAKQLPFEIEIVYDLNGSVKAELVFLESEPVLLQWKEGGDRSETLQRLAEYNIVLICSPQYDYLELARKHGIGNIILSDVLNEHVVRAVLVRLLGDTFFGFGPFFPKGYTLFHHEYAFAGHFDLASFPKEYFQDFVDTLPEGERYYFHTNINELMINALCFSVYGIKPEERDLKQTSVPARLYIPKKKEILVAIARDQEKYGISIMDRTGSLTLGRVLEKIRRHTPLGDQTVPKGITDLSGRGLFMVSRQSRLIINILKNTQTEVIFLRYHDPALNIYQSLIINEKNRLI